MTLADDGFGRLVVDGCREFADHTSCYLPAPPERCGYDGNWDVGLRFDDGPQHVLEFPLDGFGELCPWDGLCVTALISYP